MARRRKCGRVGRVMLDVAEIRARLWVLKATGGSSPSELCLSVSVLFVVWYCRMNHCSDRSKVNHCLASCVESGVFDEVAPEDLAASSRSAWASISSIFASSAVRWFSRAVAVCSPLDSSWNAW